jgi:hypothetical protein
MRRSLAESEITRILRDYGWTAPTLRTQAAAFPECTPAKDSEGRGRGAIVFDLERIDDRGVLIANVVGLKATSKSARPDTFAITTGREEHAQNVIQACQAGLDVPIIGVRLIEARWDGETLTGYDGLEAVCIRFGAKLREHGISERTTGQGRGRGQAAPIAWGRKTVTVNGKQYHYITLQANVKACEGEWKALSNMADLERFIGDNAEGIPI